MPRGGSGEDDCLAVISVRELAPGLPRNEAKHNRVWRIAHADG